MNRNELKIILEKMDIPNTGYSLYGERGLDRTILEWGLKWRIYSINEKGGEHEIAAFGTESEACEYFYNMMIKYKFFLDRMEHDVYVPTPPEVKRIFIVSNTGDTDVQKDD